MEQDLITFDDGGDDASLDLATYAQRAYLEYALSVVKGRALPDVADGQKPVQRRILHSSDTGRYRSNAYVARYDSNCTLRF